jgi:hypothetical protein
MAVDELSAKHQAGRRHVDRDVPQATHRRTTANRGRGSKRVGVRAREGRARLRELQDALPDAPIRPAPAIQVAGQATDTEVSVAAPGVGLVDGP